MFKKTFALMTSLVFVLGLSGLVLAQNVALVNQTGTVNAVTATQIGSNNFIDLDQVAVVLDNTATMTQNGSNTSAIVDQSGRDNKLITSQIGDVHSIYLKQSLGGSAWNEGYIQQYGGNGNIANLTQLITWNKNEVYLTQSGGSNIANIDQNNVRSAKIDVVQNGSGNQILDADANGAIQGSLSKATQLAGYMGIPLFIRQSGDSNDIGLRQNSPNPTLGWNNTIIYQNVGGNSLGVYQDGALDNLLNVTQGGNVTATVSQISTGSFNDCYLSQSFGSSAIVKQQSGTGPNIVSITQ